MIILFIFETDYQAELQRIKRKIDQISAEIEELKNREQDRIKRMEMLDNKIFLLESYLYKLKLREEDVKNRLYITERRIRQLQGEKGRTLERLKRGINLLYLLPKPTVWEFIFNPHRAYVYYERAVITEALIQAYKNSAVEIQNFEEEYKILKERRENLLIEIRENIKEQEKTLADLQKTREELEREVERIRKNKKEKEEYLKSLRARQEELERIIKQLAQKKRKEKVEEKLPSRGGLIWPVRGRIVREFGYYTDPKYGVRIKSNGISISAPMGSEVYSSADGKVVYAGYLEGYGNVVIIESKGLYLIYGNLMDILVGIDEVVKAGSKIGTVGGKPLYFEVREGTTPVDPLKYLP
jgi:septal ring factor EnvC (AmiA/AmiB activator)